MDHDLTGRVERAALGAMITDRHLAARLDYLRPGDFTDPRHRWVFRTICRLGAEPESAAGNWPDLIAKAASGQVTRGYLAKLVTACPDPAHGPAYGAMLVQATVYRRARNHADQMDAQAAAFGAERTRLAGASALGADQADYVGALLTQAARAVRGHTAMLAPSVPSPASEPRSVVALTDSAGPLPATRAEQREEIVLSALLREHPQAGQILSYLPAAAFTSPERQQIFRAARRLNQSGRPVDELTVSWEIAAHAAVTVVLSPGSRPEPPVPGAYVIRLARTDNSHASPLAAARDLDMRLRHRTSLGAQLPGRNPASQPSVASFVSFDRGCS